MVQQNFFDFFKKKTLVKKTLFKKNSLMFANNLVKVNTLLINLIKYLFFFKKNFFFSIYSILYISKFGVVKLIYNNQSSYLYNYAFNSNSSLLFSLNVFQKTIEKKKIKWDLFSELILLSRQRPFAKKKNKLKRSSINFYLNNLSENMLSYVKFKKKFNFYLKYFYFSFFKDSCIKRKKINYVNFFFKKIHYGLISEFISFDADLSKTLLKNICIVSIKYYSLYISYIYWQNIVVSNGFLKNFFFLKKKRGLKKKTKSFFIKRKKFKKKFKKYFLYSIFSINFILPSSKKKIFFLLNFQKNFFFMSQTQPNKNYNINYFQAKTLLFFNKKSLVYNNFYPVFFYKNILKHKLNLIYSSVLIPTHSTYFIYFLITFLESLLTSKVLVRVNNIAPISYTNKCWLKKLFFRTRFFQTTVSKHLYVNEFYEILFISFLSRDIRLLGFWFKRLMELLHISKHKKMCRVFKQTLKNNPLFFKKTKTLGFSFDIRGKLGVTGNAKKRHYYFSEGTLSFTSKNHGLMMFQTTVRTYTGVLGITMFLSY